MKKNFRDRKIYEYVVQNIQIIKVIVEYIPLNKKNIKNPTNQQSKPIKTQNKTKQKKTKEKKTGKMKILRNIEGVIHLFKFPAAQRDTIDF